MGQCRIKKVTNLSRIICRYNYRIEILKYEFYGLASQIKLNKHFRKTLFDYVINKMK